MKFTNLIAVVNNGFVNKYALGSDGQLYRWDITSTTWVIDKLIPRK